MFDFSFSEMALAGVVALVVLGPERLPKVARFVGEWVGKIQRMAANVKSELATHTDYTALAKIKQEVEDTAHDIRQDLRQVGQQFHEETIEFNRKIQPWDRLPEQKTPADFGVDENGQPIYVPASETDSWHDVPPTLTGLNVKSLKKQAMSRRRDARPRFRAKPKLRVRK